jgi:hypothetical protein
MFSAAIVSVASFTSTVGRREEVSAPTRSSNRREMVRSTDGRRFEMASYGSRSGAAVASATRWTSWQTQINGRMQYLRTTGDSPRSADRWSSPTCSVAASFFVCPSPCAKCSTRDRSCRSLTTSCLTTAYDVSSHYDFSVEACCGVRWYSAFGSAK